MKIIGRHTLKQRFIIFNQFILQSMTIESSSFEIKCINDRGSAMWPQAYVFILLRKIQVVNEESNPYTIDPSPLASYLVHLPSTPPIIIQEYFIPGGNETHAASVNTPFNGNSGPRIHFCSFTFKISVKESLLYVKESHSFCPPIITI